MRRFFLLAWACAALPAAAAPPIRDREFVVVDKGRFTVGGKPFAFVGANLAAVQGGRNRGRYRDTIEALAHDRLQVGRIWAFAEGPHDAGPWFREDHLFRAGPGGFIEESYQQLDRVLAAARAAGVRLIVSLANNWSDYGGVPEYLRWAGVAEDDPAAFYSDERVRALYREGVVKLLARTNSVTGVPYRDDPTIFSWELINESVAETPEARAARRSWIVEMARLVHERDPHHLVGAGMQGYGGRDERAEWIAVNRLAGVDYCDSHLYPQTSDRVESWQRLADYLDDRAQLARFVIGKPLVIGEFGVHTSGDDAARWLGMPRRELLAKLLARMADDGVDGALAWIYQPWPGRERDFGIYVDRPSTDDVRVELARAAERAAGGPRPKNPRLGAQQGERPLYDPFVTTVGRAAPVSGWRRDGARALLAIGPGEFQRARFEHQGTWDRTALYHFYGAGAGRVDYRFAPPPGPIARLAVRARLSSEWPGTRAPPDGGSHVEVWLDREKLGELDAVADDGIGTVHELALDGAQARRLGGGAHTLSFVVPDRPGQHGLCVYGKATGRGAVPPGVASEGIAIEAVVRAPAPPDQPPTRLRSSNALTERNARHSRAITGR